MPAHAPPETSAKERCPDTLLRLLMIVAVCSIVVVISLTAYGIYRVYANEILSQAEEDAVRIVRVMLAQEKPALFGRGDEHPDGMEIAREEMPVLDKRLRIFLAPFDIVKIKVFDRTGMIIYSTDPAIIGKPVTDNPRLERSLQGMVDSKQVTKENLRDLAEEERFDVDVVETYVPVRNSANEIAGSMELYIDVTRYRDKIVHGVGTSVGILALILLAVFGFSFGIVKSGTRQLKNYQDRLKQMATIDPLTGAYNRGAALKRAMEELSRMQRALTTPPQRSLSLIMLDIDHFKEVNDTYGHQAGDEVLRETVRRIEGGLRKHDFFGRYGGEEFIAILPHTSLEGCRIIAERLRLALCETPFVVGGHELSVSASFGLAFTTRPETSFETILKLADEGLYKAKDSGRNRVCCVMPETPENTGEGIELAG